MDVKKQLRLKFRQWMKENVTKDFSLMAGELICRSIQEKYDHQNDHPSISIFISKFPEISTLPLINHFYSIGASVYIPAWHSEEMWMCHVSSRKEFDKLLRNETGNKIPMPQTDQIRIDVHT